ncbi:9639_t:CDS:1, partial [Diversispora eburnea]
EFTDLAELSVMFGKLKVAVDNLQTKVSQEKDITSYIEQVPTTTYQCKYCTKKFSKIDEAAILSHVNAKHNNTVETTGKEKRLAYYCKSCNKVFLREFDLNNHISGKHSSKAKKRKAKKAKKAKKAQKAKESKESKESAENKGIEN